MSLGVCGNCWHLDIFILSATLKKNLLLEREELCVGGVTGKGERQMCTWLCMRTYIWKAFRLKVLTQSKPSLPPSWIELLCCQFISG